MTASVPAAFLRSAAVAIGLSCFLAATLRADDTLLLRNVNVLPMDAPRVVENQALLVKDGVIAAVGDVRAIRQPRGAKVVDGGGGFVMPGLSDMHAHVAGYTDGESAGANAEVAANQLLLYLATGVTLLRDPSGSPAHFEYRRRLREGELLGPDLYFTSPLLEGEQAVWDFAVKLVDPAEAEPLLARYAADGYWGVKVYHTLSAEVFEAVMAAAQRHGLKVIGHVPFEVGVERALASGIYSIEHLRGYDFDGMSPDALAADGGRSAERFGSLATMTDARMNELVGLTVLAGTWNTPTLAINRFLFDAEGRAALAEHPRFRLVHPNLQQAVVKSSALDDIFSAPARTALREVLPRQQALVRRLNAAGAGILIGTDAIVPAYVPGFTPIDEMQALAAGGMPVFDVLQAATRDAAVSLGIDAERGTVAAGKRASLILLERNPLEDLDALWSLRGVVHRGRWLSFAEIEDRLERQAEARAAASPDAPVKQGRGDER